MIEHHPSLLLVCCQERYALLSASQPHSFNDSLNGYVSDVVVSHKQPFAGYSESNLGISALLLLLLLWLYATTLQSCPVTAT